MVMDIQLRLSGWRYRWKRTSLIHAHVFVIVLVQDDAVCLRRKRLSVAEGIGDPIVEIPAVTLMRSNIDEDDRQNDILQPDGIRGRRQGEERVLNTDAGIVPIVLIQYDPGHAIGS